MEDDGPRTARIDWSKGSRARDGVRRNCSRAFSSGFADVDQYGACLDQAPGARDIDDWK